MYEGATAAIATLGGLITVTDESGVEVYGITAAHPLAEIYRATYTPGHMQKATEEADGNHDYYDHDIWSTSEDEDGEDAQDQEYEDVVQDEGVVVPALFRPFGTVRAASIHPSFPRGNYDWAVISILHKGDRMRNLLPPNLTYSTLSPSPPRTQDSAPAWDASYDGNKPLLLSLGPDEPPLGTSCPATAITSRGLQRGTLTANASSLMVSPGTFVEALDFMPNAESGGSSSASAMISSRPDGSQN
jgi:hypothetical protein